MQVKTVDLTGEETKIVFDKTYHFVEINNLSGNEILVSTKPEIVRGNDDVIIVSAKTIATIGDTGYAGIKEIYASGSGEIQLIGKNFAEHCFKLPASGGNSDVPDVLKFLPYPEDFLYYYDWSYGVETTSWTDCLKQNTITTNDGYSFVKDDDGIYLPSSSYDVAACPFISTPELITTPITLYIVTKYESSSSTRYIRYVNYSLISGSRVWLTSIQASMSTSGSLGVDVQRYVTGTSTSRCLEASVPNFNKNDPFVIGLVLQSKQTSLIVDDTVASESAKALDAWGLALAPNVHYKAVAVVSNETNVVDIEHVKANVAALKNHYNIS